MGIYATENLNINSNYVSYTITARRIGDGSMPPARCLQEAWI